MNTTNVKKRKVGTILEVSLFKNLKIQAAEENRPMADIIADAIELYLSQNQTPVEAESNVSSFVG